MNQALYPKAKYPQGHPDLARNLHNLGALLRDQGEYGRARDYYERALAMSEDLYPKAQYPQGHPDLAISLNNLGHLLQNQGEYGRARDYYERALAMSEDLYPKAQYPQGHPRLALSLNNLGVLLEAQGEHGRARDYLERALAMRQALYPTAKYPQGHPDLAQSLNNLGHLLRDQGEYGRARDYSERALAMYEALYPTAQYPQGNPALAQSLSNLSGLLLARGEDGRARDYLERALAMHEDLAERFTATAAEAEALNFAASLPLTRDGYLSATRHLAQADAACYAHLWRGKAVLARLLHARQRELRLLARADPETQTRVRDYLATRQQLARWLLAPAGSLPDLAERVQKLTDLKEQQERELARKLPAFAALLQRDRRPHTDLLEKLPAHTAFIDLLRYVRFDHDPEKPGKAGEKRTPCYVGFVLAPGRAVRRVELGPARDIEEAWASWHESLLARRPQPAAATRLRGLVWDKLAEHLPPGTRTIFLAPDAALASLPWAALPGRRPGAFLLEEYALALVPHGPFLLDRLTAQDQPPPGPGLLLAVGGVNYDMEVQPPTAKIGEKLVLRAPARDKQGKLWGELPGTLQEAEQITTLAGQRPWHLRRGSQAGTGQLLLDLPRARWAHLATHGFFADKRFRSVLQADEKQFALGRFGLERAAAGARNPLVLSGLVLAGANLPLKDPERQDGGILTAEMVAGLDLAGLELAVLSACESGLGEEAGGEGVFGLQRAFHVAGAQTVVASLWRVDDAATQALMQEFYRNLWQRKLPKLVALRQAQLAMLLHYDARQGKLRGPGAAVPADPKALARARQEARAAGRPPLPPLYWAGFVLSGDWR
jgi:CHAT domain-containing protein/Tfp pilus assembly protein PilF